MSRAVSPLRAADLIQSRVCELIFGSYNDYYVPYEGKKTGETFIIYNPEIIGRGIYFNGSSLQKGIAVISISCPYLQAQRPNPRLWSSYRHRLSDW